MRCGLGPLCLLRDGILFARVGHAVSGMQTETRTGQQHRPVQTGPASLFHLLSCIDDASLMIGTGVKQKRDP